MAGLGHDVQRAADIGLSRAADEELLEAAQKQGRLFVTRDRDFGRIVFLKRKRAGVLYLRMMPAMLHAVHEVLAEVLRTNNETVLAQAFVAITPGGYRIRELTNM